jgi:hypothetical protein
MNEQKKRSDHIVKFVKSHPAINESMICRLAGGYDVCNFSNSLNGKRLISKRALPLFEKVLKEYGFIPLKEYE